MPRPYIKPIGAASLVAAVVVAWVWYSTTFGRFVAAETLPSGIYLHFDGPMAKNLLVPREAIDTVLFGLPGKSNRKCYIKIRLKSGESYRSVTFDSDLEACKQLRLNLNLPRKEIP